MRNELGHVLFAVVVGLGLAFMAVHLAGCGGAGRTTEARVHTALDVLADVIDPASELADRACEEQQLLTATAAETGAISGGRAAEIVKQVRTRCAALERIFTMLRNQHQQAVEFAASGKLDEARALVEEIRATMRDLEGGAS